MSDELNQAASIQAIRRILVALDASTHSLAALEVAARLAATSHAKLIGLFVEDINLLRLAGLPFAQEVRWPTTQGQALDETRMERDLRLRASQARRALASAAEEVEAEWTFRVVRGVVTKEVLEAALEADLLTLGRASRTLTKRVRLGSTAQAAATDAPKSVFLARQGTDATLPIVVTFDGTATGLQALDAATQMAETNKSNLIVLVMTEEPEEAPQLAEQASATVDKKVAHSEYRYLPTDDGDNLVEALRNEDCSMLVLGGDHPRLSSEMLQKVLDEMDCPVMLVR